jgi:ElaB/YqjD/DUF883 family membrane-anchored ribosome-binding protein
MDPSGKLDTLMRETEELLERIADERAPQIQRLRERLQDSLAKARSAMEEERVSTHGDGKSNGNGSGRAAQRVGVRDLAGSLNDYVRRYPWLALATGVLVASSVGILATHATKRSYLHDS